MTHQCLTGIDSAWGCTTDCPAPQYPPFEGAEVHGAKVKISAPASAMEFDDLVVKVDDVVRVVVTAKVVGVHHDVHHASGRLVRVQLAKVQDVELWSAGG